MAVKKKKQDAPAGAPEWMVTYGDMVTLLLTFFVLLLTFMEPVKEQQMQSAMEVIREAFGADGGERQIPLDELQLPDNMDAMMLLMVPPDPHQPSPTEDEGQTGRRPLIKAIRPDTFYQRGAKYAFAELSAELSAEQKADIATYALDLRGHATQISLRASCSKRPVEGSAFDSHWELCYARAVAVFDLLVAGGVEAERIIISLDGTNRPIKPEAYNVTDREQNDVVEIFQIDKTVDAFEGA